MIATSDPLSRLALRITEVGPRITSDRSQIVAVDHFMIMGSHFPAIAADLDQIVSPILA
jgi:hypothetical protein